MDNSIPNQEMSVAPPRSTLEQNPPIQSPKKTLYSSKLFLLIVILIVLSFGIAEAYYFLNSKNQAQKTIIAPSPTPIDETANWKTYKDRYYGFEIKYPQNFNLNLDPVFILKAPNNIEYLQIQEFSVYSDESKERILEGLRYYEPFGAKLIKEITLAGKKTFVFEAKEAKFPDGPLPEELKGIPYTVYSIYLDNENSRIEIQFFGKGENRRIFEKVVSTFSLISQEEMNNPANWRTFTNKTYGYSFKYPLNMQAGQAYTPDAQSEAIRDLNIDLDLTGSTKKILTIATYSNSKLGNISLENFVKQTVTPADKVTLTNEVHLKIGRLDGLSETVTFSDPGLRSGVWYFTKDSKNYYQLITTEKTTSSLTTKILSTFKFLDQNQVSNNSNLKTFTSSTLGITFTYLKELTVKETGNKACITYGEQNSNCLNGHSVEVFQKLKTQTLAQAIKQQFLSNYSEKDCFVSTSTYAKTVHTSIKNYETAEITFPKVSDPNLPWWYNADKCPVTYVTANFVAYFLMDNNHPDKYLFFNLGQGPIIAGNEWYDSVTFLN